MYIFWLISILHFLWGIIVLLYPESYNTTPIFFIGEFLGGRYITGICLLITGTLAFIGMLRSPYSQKHVAFFIPQQMFITIAAYGVIVTSIMGTYADGVLRPRMFILADQLPIIIMFLLHSFAFARKFILNHGN